MGENNNQNNLRVPIALIVAALVLSGALFLSYSKANNKQSNEEETKLLQKVETLLVSDHFLGNPKAEIILVEYSGYDCSFCAGYFINMKKIMEEFGKTGKILWIHRHMPFDQIYSRATEKAIMAECAGTTGGEEIFWLASEKLYEATTSKKDLTPSDLRVLLGLNKSLYDECLLKESVREKVRREYDEAYNAGVRGIPFTVVIKGEERYGIAESLPYFELRTLVESLLNK